MQTHSLAHKIIPSIKYNVFKKSTSVWDDKSHIIYKYIRFRLSHGFRWNWKIVEMLQQKSDQRKTEIVYYMSCNKCCGQLVSEPLTDSSSLNSFTHCTPFEFHQLICQMDPVLLDFERMHYPLFDCFHRMVSILMIFTFETIWIHFQSFLSFQNSSIDGDFEDPFQSIFTFKSIQTQTFISLKKIRWIAYLNLWFRHPCKSKICMNVRNEIKRFVCLVIPNAYASFARSGPARYFVCSNVFSSANICCPLNVGLVCFFLPSLSELWCCERPADTGSWNKHIRLLICALQILEMYLKRSSFDAYLIERIVKEKNFFERSCLCFCYCS